jgi:hypothetical protein
METTRRPPRPTRLSEWFNSHPSRARSASDFEPSGKLAKEYLDFLWPIGMTYASPLNPLFLVECSDPRQLSRRRTWASRDGLVPLLWFFHQNPEPRGFSGELLIPSDFSACVPHSWRKQVALVDWTSSERPAARPKFLLTGLAMNTYCSIEQLEEILGALQRDFGDLRRCETRALLLSRFDGWGQEHDHDYHPRYFMKLHTAFGEFQPMKWPEFDSNSDLRGWTVIDLNGRSLVSDSFLTQNALGRGASLWTPRTLDAMPTSASEYIPLSPYHGARVHSRYPSQTFLPLSPEQEKRFAFALASETNRRFPWPNWFTSWAQLATTAQAQASKKAASAAKSSRTRSPNIRTSNSGPAKQPPRRSSRATSRFETDPPAH